MDISSLMTTLLSDDTVKNLSKKSGASTADVKKVLASALPSLLNGANQQAQNKKTSDGFAGALLQHAKNDTSSLGSFLDKVDLDDGAKIIGHLLGSDVAATQKAVSKKSGVDAKTTAKILAMAAPLLMSLLGKQAEEDDKKDDVGGLMGALLGNSNIGSLAASLLGGSGSGKKDDGIDLGDIASLLGKLL